MKQATIGSAWVLGSTSTVAIAICRSLAERGCRRFHLLARNQHRNQVLVDELRDCFGAEVDCSTFDLLTVSSELPQLDEIFDLYLVAAGNLGDADLARRNVVEAQAITQSNFTGLIPWLTAIVTPERIKQPGALWVFSSVAADRGRPSNYHYGAAKAGLLRFCEGLMLCCHGTPFSVRILKAGFISSPMTVDKAPPLLCAQPEQIAQDLLRNPHRRGTEANRPYPAAPKPERWLKVLAAILLFSALAGLLQLDPETKVNLINGLTRLPSWLPAIVSVLAISYGGRYWRFRLLLRAEGVGCFSFREAWMWFKGFALTATPGKVGELSRVHFLNKSFGYPRASLLHTFFAERFCDVAAVVIWLALLVPGQLQKQVSPWSPYVMSATVLVFLVAGLLCIWL